MKNKLYTLYEHTVRSNMGNSEKTVITDFSASEMNWTAMMHTVKQKS